MTEYTRGFIDGILSFIFGVGLFENLKRSWKSVLTKKLDDDHAAN